MKSTHALLDEELAKLAQTSEPDPVMRLAEWAYRYAARTAPGPKRKQPKTLAAVAQRHTKSRGKR